MSWSGRAITSNDFFIKHELVLTKDGRFTWAVKQTKEDRVTKILKDVDAIPDSTPIHSRGKRVQR